MEENKNKVNKEDSSNLSETKMCFICFSEESNVVIFHCGHGGLCTKCAIDLWKTKNKCYLCRKVILI